MFPSTYAISEQPGEEESDGPSPNIDFENEFKIATRELQNSRNDVVVCKKPEVETKSQTVYSTITSEFGA